ncbi:MAG: hypothetical protein J7L44_04440 [Candidatus Diapherotrites archaeon]|nr:hypothetical protein [Candidatus Diapherotrites archaeon]
MNSEKRKMLFSVFMAIVIIGSILSLAINPKGRAREEPQANATPPVEPPKGTFKAENVDANIEQLTSSYRIYGYTENYNTYELLEQIKAIKGIKGIYNPAYRESKQLEQKVLFVFDATLEEDYNIEAVFDALEEKGILSDVGAYRKAMVKIPPEIELKGIDNNATKKVKFDTPFIVALVGLNSKPGDMLKITLFAQLQGNVPIKNAIEAFEEQNISAMPAFFEQDINASIESLKNTILVSQEIAYNGFSLDSLKADLNALKDINDSTVTVHFLSDRFMVRVWADSNTDSLLADLNDFKEKPIEKIELSKRLDKNAVLLEVSFDSSSAENYAGAKQTLASMLESKGVSFEIGDANAFLNARITLARSVHGKDAETIAEKIATVFANYGVLLSESSFAQEAALDINSVTRPDTGASIPVKEPVAARLTLGHNVGDVVEAKVSFYAMRNELVYITAVEKALADMQVS